MVYNAVAWCTQTKQFLLKNVFPLKEKKLYLPEKKFLKQKKPNNFLSKKLLFLCEKVRFVLNTAMLFCMLAKLN